MWAKHSITIAPWDSIPEQMAELGLSDDDGGAQVWFVDDADTLRSFEAKILFYDQGRVFIENYQPFQELRVVVTPLRSFISGMAVAPETLKGEPI